MEDQITCPSSAGGTITLPRSRFKFRPSAYALIVRDKKLLMIRLTMNGKLFCPGGGVEPGERLEAAVKREAFEESGQMIRVGSIYRFVEHFYYFAPTDSAWQVFAFYYRCEIDGPLRELVAGDPEEGQPEWVPISAVLADDALHSTAEDVVPDYLCDLGLATRAVWSD